MSGAPRETVVWIGVNGVRRRVLTGSPHDPAALVIGHLAGDGWIDDIDDIHSIECVGGPGQARGVSVEIDADRERAASSLLRHRIEHGCGLRHELDCAPDTLRVPRDARLDPSGLDLSEPFRELFAAAQRASDAGGVHAAALVDGAAIRFLDVDVARHSAQDRVIGRALQARVDPGGLGLLLSARLSGAMALRAVRAGVAWIASRSIATSLAAEIANAAGLPVRQRAIRRDAT